MDDNKKQDFQRNAAPPVTRARGRPRKNLSPVFLANIARPGDVKNPTGISMPADKREMYRIARMKAMVVAPEMIDVQIALARDRDCDPRVRAYCSNSLLDRAGIKALDKPETDDDARERFDPERLTPRQLAQLEGALRLYLKALVPESEVSATDARGEPIRGEILPPESEES